MSKNAASQSRAERAAAALDDQQRRERRRRSAMVGGVLVVVAAVILAGFLINRSRDTSTDVSAPSSDQWGVAIGDPSAPHTVVIYEDFLCPYCGKFEAASRRDLARLADAGVVHVEYRPFDLLNTPYSLASAAAFKVVLDQAGPEVAKEFHDLLYAEQPNEAGPYPDTDWLVDLAVRAGATESEVRPGIEQGQGESWVQDATQAAVQAGVRGTPTVLLDGQVFQDARTIEELATNLIAQLEAGTGN